MHSHVTEFDQPVVTLCGWQDVKSPISNSLTVINCNCIFVVHFMCRPLSAHFNFMCRPLSAHLSIDLSLYALVCMWLHVLDLSGIGLITWSLGFIS